MWSAINERLAEHWYQIALTFNQIALIICSRTYFVSRDMVFLSEAEPFRIDGLGSASS